MKTGRTLLLLATALSVGGILSSAGIALGVPLAIRLVINGWGGWMLGWYWERICDHFGIFPA